jgi:Sugar (and other) transporter
VAFAMVTHWVCNFGIGQLFLPAVARYGVSTVYLGFAAVCVTAALFVAGFVLETKGRTLEQIEAAMAA